MSKEHRIPAPEYVAEINPASLEALAQLTPLDHSQCHTINVAKYNVLAAEEDELPRIIHPIGRLAIEDYADQYGVAPTHVKITVSSKSRDPAPREWHRDQLFPSENLYIIASADATEFAVGEGLPYINELPGRLPLNGLVDWLIRKHRLNVVSTPPNTLTKFSSQHIHRVPAIEQDGRVCISFSAYNHELAYQGVYGGSKIDELRFKLQVL